MTRLLLIVAALIFGGCSGRALARPQPEKSGCKEIPGEVCVCGQGKSCACQAPDELLNPDSIIGDGTMFRALLTVVEYRRGPQASSLKASELDIRNFNIGVSRNPGPDWPNAYVVNFSVKGAPGEPGPKLNGTSLGRSYAYFVDKTTWQVVKHERQE